MKTYTMLVIFALAFSQGLAKTSIQVLHPKTPAADTAEADPVAPIVKAATDHAHQYFMTKSVIGIPSSARPEKVDIVIEDTKPVDGWTARYCVSGTATVTTASIYAPNYACHFDITAELDAHGKPQIISMESKRI